jgi:hypothetical protein
MREQSNSKFEATFVGLLAPLTRRQAKALQVLRKATEECEPICSQAPIIWDAENPEDMRYAKKFCLGLYEKDENPIEPCPILNLCRETALIVEPYGGVWGGMNDLDRRRILKKLR